MTHTGMTHTGMTGSGMTGSASIVPVWRVYPQVRQYDPLAGGNGSGGLWRSPTSSAIANSAAEDSTPRSASHSGCGP
jgi:hypothetical protein